MKIVPLRILPFLICDPNLMPASVVKFRDEASIRNALDIFRDHPDALDWPGREAALEEIVGKPCMTSMSDDEVGAQLLAMRLWRHPDRGANWPVEATARVFDWRGPDDIDVLHRDFSKENARFVEKGRGAVGWTLDGVAVWRLAMGVA